MRSGTEQPARGSKTNQKIGLPLILKPHSVSARCEGPDELMGKTALAARSLQVSTFAAAVGSRRRGVEPLRILVMPQRVTHVTVAPVAVIEPMPIID